MKERDKLLTSVFADVGGRFGYGDVEAVFTAFRDFKVKWSRSYRWARFDVSDYLSDAPEEVLRSIAETLFGRIRGDEGVGYGEEVCNWVSSPEFVAEKQPVYVNRCRGVSRTTKGSCRDLRDSYDRLVGMGLVERDPLMYMGWGVPTQGRYVGRSSTLMRVVVMSTILDTEEVPEDLLDFCLYSQLIHVIMGFNPYPDGREEEYDEMLSRFPDRAGMEDLMAKLSIRM